MSRKRSSSSRKRVKPEQLAPKIAEGFTQDVPLDRVQQELPRRSDGPIDLRELTQPKTVEGTRVPLPKFLVEDDTTGVWTPTRGRVQRGARIILLPETLAAMKAGWICLRCMEPQDEAFPAVCQSPPEMGCVYPIAERQLRDIAVEYEGETELGPTPIERSE
jgi:hypothetical protein